MKIEIDRRDVCKLILACTMVDISTEGKNKQWKELHDKLMEQLNKFDEREA